jgi:excisionase family DNA binding protein
MINLLKQLPDSISVTVTKRDLMDVIDICLSKNQNDTAKTFPEHLSIKQLSEYINYSEPAIYKMVSQATIPCYKISGKLLFKRAEIDSWVLDFKQPTIKERINELNEGRKVR